MRSNPKRIYGYARVSTSGQELDIQLAQLDAAKCERVFSEKESGVKDKRPVLSHLLRKLRPGDVVIVCALGGVDSKDSLLGANQIQDFFWGGSLGCDGAVGFERRGVGTDGAADHRPT